MFDQQWLANSILFDVYFEVRIALFYLLYFLTQYVSSAY